MPIFHNSNQGVGEIMTVTPGPDKDSVIVHFEDSENPGKLLTETVNAKDLKQEIAQQRKK